MKFIHIKKHILLILFLLFYLSINVYKLTTSPTPFYDWDESIYIQAGKEMIENKSLLPSWNESPWLEKPPLAPFLYGLFTVYSNTPEISTRLFSLFLSIIVLALIYLWVVKISKSKIIALTTVVITAFNPIFLQRTQVVNTDSLLLIGWLGYLLYFPRFYLSFFFLFLGVFSKSLLGFYPAILYLTFETYNFVFKNKTIKKQAILNIKKIILQVLILSIWFFIMFVIYKQKFIQIHFSDHLFRRITSSIESHFGKRTFYFDIILKEYSYSIIFLLLGSFIIIKKYLAKKINDNIIFLSIAFIPFFLFLNLTKTKISWYLYPTILQFAFLIAYPLILLKKLKALQYLLGFIIIGFVIYQSIFINSYFKNFYSQYDETYRITLFAKNKCSSIIILPSENERKTHNALKSMNLLISTSEQYGNKPSIFYYFEKPVFFVYSPEDIISTKGSCLLINKNDIDYIKKLEFEKIKQENDLLLLKIH